MEIIIFIYYSIAIVYEIYSVKKRFVTLSFIFIGMQILMFSGILTYADFTYSADRKLVFIYLIALVMFIFGTEISSHLYIADYRRIRLSENDKLSHNQKKLIILLITISVMACMYLFLSSGYNVFFMILKSIGTGSQDNFTNSRIALNNVQGIGYIYQFRVIILPILCAFLTIYKEDKKIHKFGIAIFPLMIIFVLGTGQRGGFVMFVLIFLVALFYLYQIYREKKILKKIVIIGFGAIVLFATMTIFNGRVGSDGDLVQATLQRIFDDNQKCAVVAFRFICTQNIQWGKDWFLSFMDIFPGKNSYVQLSYVIFDVMYGSTRGTAPPCIWGSAYYNFGFIGIVIMPLIMGFLYHKLYYKFCLHPATKIRIFLYSAKFVVLGSWIADTPLVLFNQGFVTLCIMTLLLDINHGFKRKYYREIVYESKL